jgi:hypothetical protein
VQDFANLYKGNPIAGNFDLAQEMGIQETVVPWLSESGSHL